MHKQSLLNLLYSKHRLGIKPGLERTLRLAQFVGNPQNEYDTIHVAGTNGKGTSCSVINSLLVESGLKVGLYTSPHIKDFNERIRVNGTQITDDELIRYSEKILPFADKIDATFFEITTIMAFLHFMEMAVDVAVVETGMGGQFDSTNIITPKLSIITDIDMDHEEYLGDTIEKIAYEKAGIIKSGVPVFTSNSEQNVLQVIRSKANELNSILLPILTDLNSEVVKEIDKHYISHSFKKNYRTALSATEVYLSKEIEPTIQQLAIRNLAENSGYMARMQIVNDKPTCILDISHSVAACTNLVDSVVSKFGNEKKWNIIFTLMNDKDCEGILAELKPICGVLIITTTANERNMTVSEIAVIAKKLAIRYSINEDPNNAYSEAILNGDDTIITGSFYLAAEII